MPGVHSRFSARRATTEIRRAKFSQRVLWRRFPFSTFPGPGRAARSPAKSATPLRDIRLPGPAFARTQFDVAPPAKLGSYLNIQHFNFPTRLCRAGPLQIRMAWPYSRRSGFRFLANVECLGTTPRVPFDSGGHDLYGSAQCRILFRESVRSFATRRRPARKSRSE